MKDIVTPVTPEEVKTVVRKCLENAALVNYTKISQAARVEGKTLALIDSIRGAYFIGIVFLFLNDFGTFLKNHGRKCVIFTEMSSLFFNVFYLFIYLFS